MAEFKIIARNPDGLLRTFFFDNVESKIFDSGHCEIRPYFKGLNLNQSGFKSDDTVSLGESKCGIKKIKISLGLGCNYSCQYCNQKHVLESDAEAKAKDRDVQKFIENLDQWLESPPKSVEFWGGEPLLYFERIKLLAVALREKFPKVRFTIITNGSLLTQEKNEWLDQMGFTVGISHDGPGQAVRGPDPFNKPEKKAAILDLFNRLHPKRRISFNPCLNIKNRSRIKIKNFFREITGCDDVSLGEGAFISPYDANGVKLSLRTPEEMAEFSILTFYELRSGELGRNFQIVEQRLLQFAQFVGANRSTSELGQKCGMDRSDSIAVDLEGNVLTCQNVSANSTAPNGKSHKIGHVSALNQVKMESITHWSKRKDCAKCPVLQLCQGSCMFLEGEEWDVGCNNSFADNIAFFAAGFEEATGFIPIEIHGGREDRVHLWRAIENSVDRSVESMEQAIAP